MTDQKHDVNRRNFIAAGSSLAAMAAMMQAFEARAEESGDESTARRTDDSTPPMRMGLIGYGPHGREIARNLAQLPSAPLVAISDNYGPMLRRSKREHPKAKGYEKFQDLLADKNVEGVIIATAPHEHKAIVLAALKAGKHVYCEAPLGHTLADARAIAKAAADNPKQNFQAGLQFRSEPQRHFMFPFMRSGALGRAVQARTQWHKKTSWRRVSPNGVREKAINWRLNKELSPGLAGEVGMHQADLVNYFLNLKPIAVSGFGNTIQWRDGRQVPDTVNLVYEYENGFSLTQELTLSNSFDGEYEVMHGTNSAVMLRGSQAWMYKEADAPLIGWEVYARKEAHYGKPGVVLAAGATTLGKSGKKLYQESTFTQTPIFYSLEAFAYNSHQVKTTVADLVEAFGEPDNETVIEFLKDQLGTTNSLLPAANSVEGFQANVIALKANEAVNTRKRVEITAADLTI
ncbi:MAG: Gfo/Idh/MocA family oxidoreductase [Verrucomicrobiales bacterium]|nr:Gfo/Idh/MocA family oxidoreductase [Verrucomicrobiales bacterium]